MKINAATQRPLALLLLLAFLHGVLAPVLGMAAGHAAVHTMLVPMCGEGTAFVEVEIDGNSDSSSDLFGHAGFCLLCCCPSPPAEIDVTSPWLTICAAHIKPAALADTPQTRTALWRPTLPRAPPSLSR